MTRQVVPGPAPAGAASYLREQERLGSRPRSAPRLRIVLFNEWSGDPVARIDEECACAGDQPAGDEAAGGPGRPDALADTLEAWTADRNVQALLILDQFEEYFLYHRDEDDEGGFAAQFARAVNRRGIPVSFLVAIREDALPSWTASRAASPGCSRTTCACATCGPARPPGRSPARWSG